MERLSPGIRLTASDRPGVAQPVPERDVPDRPWGSILLAGLALAALLLAGWEWHWRTFGAEPAIRNSDGLWALHRRRIDSGEGDATVFIGSSRVMFDVQLHVWERLSGRKPIQLALEGTSPMPVLEDLAEDEDFRGTLFVGVTPGLFFSGRGFRGGVVKHYHDESPSDRVGQWISMHLLEPYWAFYDPDFTLTKVVERLPWPMRPGKPVRLPVRKLSVSDKSRSMRMWSKVVDDVEYRDYARRVWAQNFKPSPDAPPPEVMAKTREEQIDKAAAAVAKLRARGVTVVFVRAPSSGDFLESERRQTPRADTWDMLLARTGAPGIHFEDHPDMQGLDLPEWSHLRPDHAERFTEALYRAAMAITAAPKAPQEP